MSSPGPAQLRVILEDNDVRKLILPAGIPNTVDELLSVVIEAFKLSTGNYRLMYKDKDFDDFFTLTSTGEIKNKDSVKLVKPEPSVILTLTPITHLDTPSTSGALDHSTTDGCASITSWDPDCSFARSGETVRIEKWPAHFKIPQFSIDIERMLESGNREFLENGKHLQKPSIRSAILQKLAEVIFQYTAYPTNLQITSVTEALIQKHPCLQEPGSLSRMYGWQQSLRYKMANYRAKLRTCESRYPELDINSERKQGSNTAPAKNIKKPKKAEVNFLPPHPVEETVESLENERQALLNEVKKKNNDRLIAEKMSLTFSCRRLEVVNNSPAVKDFKERWPALFTEAQIKEEFRRLTAVSLEHTFMQKLDGFTPKLLNVLRAKGGVSGIKIRPILDALSMSQGIDNRRDAVIRGLIEYLGEKAENLFRDCSNDNPDEYTADVIKILVVDGSRGEEPEVSIVIEGCKVLAKCGNTAKACTLLIGIIYALNLQYPLNLKYTFEVFQKLFLDLNGVRPSPKIQSLKNKLLA